MITVFNKNIVSPNRIYNDYYTTFDTKNTEIGLFIHTHFVISSIAAV